MAKKLSPDGMPVDIPSINRSKRRTTLFDGIPSAPKHGATDSDPEEAATVVHTGGTASEVHTDDPPTKPVGLPRRLPATSDLAHSDDPKTVIAGGWRRRSVTHAHSADASDPASARPSPARDPVVGWLVVVDGPGRGTSLRLGMGQNTIGRGTGARVRINFGDNEISRTNHAVVTYDPRGSHFYVQPGRGLNLTYLEDEPVLVPQRLPNRSRITVGKTTLRFVALCDGSFDWNNSEGREDD